MGRWGRKEEEEVVKGTEEGVPGAPEVSTAGRECCEHRQVG